MPTVAETLAKSAALGRLLNTTLDELRHKGALQAAPTKGELKMSVTSIADRVRVLREALHQRQVNVEKDFAARLDVAEMRAKDALDKLEAKLTSDTTAHEAEVRALEDEVNQLTNGAPG